MLKDLLYSIANNEVEATINIVKVRFFTNSFDQIGSALTAAIVASFAPVVTS